MQPELTSSEIEMLSFDCADDRIAAYLQRRAAMAHDDEAQDEELTPSEMEMLMLDNVDDRIAAYVAHRMISANVDKTTATETTVDNDHTKSAVDTMGQGAADQELPPAPTDPLRLGVPKSIEGTVYDLSRPNGCDYTVCASCYAAYKHTYAPDDIFIAKPAIPPALVVRFAAEAKTIDVTNLDFVATNGMHVPPADVAAVFEAHTVHHCTTRRLAAPKLFVFVFFLL
ncbi:hypothetical protein SPRG_12025 [Saprolegnia parasitica CBS 223.65]|uniref:Uncharacterized protein n=1 Tax=Saprolegnia parasitica (strain CBS 223.65) TaxID=695850 RepID=A0A067BX87_SAPPC|nr:hypothetical protein SPRG_12025 [Saprolegnia parasitica CBS 223.65]KDO22888.1 hypothetical protein SPRG_12025 [Saprolegnia parasitica CBS 223.65]|eukprot:XP_012206443.1 hypothetical protein SPRG_12025 [Saprolegnia parasitica CBS 223.65]